MSEEQELQPLVAGAITVDERETLDFPINQMIQVHVKEGRYGKFPKEVEDKDTGEKKIIVQNKVSFIFVVDSDISDRKTNKPLKGKTFNKTITLSKHDAATYPKFIAAVTGGYNADPAVALNKPLQVLFGEWAEFSGTAYQPITYLPPANGQQVPKGDTVLTAEEVEEITLDEVFGPPKTTEQ